MSYQSGHMGMAEGLALVFVITFPPVFLGTPSQSIETAGELAWLTPIIAGLATLVMLFALLYVFKRTSGDLFVAANHLVGKLGAWLIGLYYMGLFLTIAAIWIREFAENTLITALPALNFQLAVGWYSLGAAFILYFGIEVIAQAAYIILPFGVIGLLLVLMLLEPFYKVNYLFPWQGTGLINTLTVGVLVGVNAGAMLLPVIASSFQKNKTLQAAAIFGLGGSALLKAAAILVFTMVFGKEVAIERALPFYEMARLIFINRYIQRLEAVFITLWVIVGIFSIAISLYMVLYLIGRMVNLPAISPLIPTVTIIAAELAMIPADINKTLELEKILMQTYYNIGIYGIPLLLFTVSLWKGKRRTKCASE